MSLMPLDLIIKAMNSIEGQYLWIDFSENPTMTVLSSNGLYEPSPYAVFFESPIEGPFILTDKNYKNFKRKNPDLNQIDELSEEYYQAVMFLEGCKPNMRYYKWGPDMNEDKNYHERDAIFKDLKELILKQGEPIAWEDVSEQELIKYYFIMQVAQKGYSSWDEIPSMNNIVESRIMKRRI
jgi:hypothetical protein